MMRKSLALYTVSVFLVTILCISGGPAQAQSKSSQWLATGIVTRVTPDTLYLLGKDDVIYRINAVGSKVLIEDEQGQFSSIRVGDKVRVFGKKTGEKSVRALQLNVLEAAPVARVIPPVEPEDKIIKAEPSIPPIPAPVPTPQPRDISPPEIIIPPLGPEVGRGPAIITQTEPSFTGRGLVKDVHLTEGWLTLLTGKGPIAVDIDGAQVTSRGKGTSTAEISVGDAVYIWGERTGTGKISATKIDILGEKSQAEAVNPVSAVSTTGTIRSLDHPAFTFVMDNSPGFIFVMSDEDTTIRSAAGKQIGFSDLRLGMKVKVSGLGSLTTGYLAQQIIVIGTKR